MHWSCLPPLLPISQGQDTNLWRAHRPIGNREQPYALNSPLGRVPDRCWRRLYSATTQTPLPHFSNRLDGSFEGRPRVRQKGQTFFPNEKKQTYREENTHQEHVVLFVIRMHGQTLRYPQRTHHQNLASETATTRLH